MRDGRSTGSSAGRSRGHFGGAGQAREGGEPRYTLLPKKSSALLKNRRLSLAPAGGAFRAGVFARAAGTSRSISLVRLTRSAAAFLIPHHSFRAAAASGRPIEIRAARLAHVNSASRLDGLAERNQLGGHGPRAGVVP